MGDREFLLGDRERWAARLLSAIVSTGRGDAWGVALPGAMDGALDAAVDDTVGDGMPDDVDTLVLPIPSCPLNLLTRLLPAPEFA